ncbi:MAG: FAD-binding oxidoreductase [Moorea sp. SIO2B7]|nr:FAD-binding oxidoreductase [Moorena sp. SIO2B7]
MTRIAIIGSGIVGASIAYELSQIEGLTITLLDQKYPSSGSTGAALGVLMGVISHKTKGRAWRLRQTSIERYETLIPELEALTGDQIPQNRQGILMLRFVGEDVQRWEKLVEIRHKQGFQLEIWDLGQLKAKCPQLQDDKIIGAIYSPQDRQINPTILTQALIAGASKNRVDCQFDLKVQKCYSTNLNGSNRRLCDKIYTTNGVLEVDWVVIAAGLGSTPLTASLRQTIDIRPVLGQALHLHLNHPLGHQDFQPVITGDDVHIIPLGKGEYWVGATVEFSNDKGEVVADASMLEKVKQDAITFCPALADATIIRTWSGKRPRPEGQPAPIIGQLAGYSNVLLATGHYRNGVLLAPATAIAIREEISKFSP